MRPGALVVSLDFELHWGVLERAADGPYRANLEGVPESVRGTLALFREFGIAATWATVGFLFARSRGERERFSPAVRPRYSVPLPDPYRVPTGEGEADDPLHYAPTLVAEIGATPGQELATHTFSHLYCLEPAENLREAFRHDLRAAQAIMRETAGVQARSIVFPRNQHNPAFDDLLAGEGITCFRGCTRAFGWAPRARAGHTLAMRAARAVDAYAGGAHSVRWSEVRQPSGLCNLPARLLLRPGSAGLKARRIVRALRHAARAGEILHLWWHPHNFGAHPARELATLRTLLESFARLREGEGMESLSMADVAARCAGPC